MRALFDVNFLIALFQSDHVHYRQAHEWWSGHAGQGWASCPLTQNGFARILSQPKYMQSMSLKDALALLQRAIAIGNHVFWPDDVSILDSQLFDDRHLVGPKQLTDAYLLALAVKNGGRLVTFDRTIPINAVRGAEVRHVVVAI